MQRSQQNGKKGRSRTVRYAWTLPHHGHSTMLSCADVAYSPDFFDEALDSLLLSVVLALDEPLSFSALAFCL